MILQALNRYYQRLADDPEADVAPPGFGQVKIGFALVLDRKGKLVDVHDLREQSGKKLEAPPRLAPQPVKRSVGIKANFLWDNTGYVLGADNKDKPERARKAFDDFRALAHQLGDGLDDPGMKAVLAFLDAWQPGEAGGLDSWEEMAGQNVCFRLDGERGFVHDARVVKDAWFDHWASAEAEAQGQCLVTGEMTALARLHPAIKGVWGAQSSGANLVSFNLDAFTSYGKDQSYNAPVGDGAAFAYTTALNRLLAKGSRQRLQIGDASVVFWSENRSPVEDWFGFALRADQAEDEALNQEVREYVKAAKAGRRPPKIDPQNPFYILGLSPNASRISVRFWWPSTVGEITDRLGQHFQDLEIVRQYDNQPEDPPLWMVLNETAAQHKTENVPPQLAGEVAQAVFSGRPYPRSLLVALVSRARADKQVGYVRAAFIKAYLSRAYRLIESYRHNPKSMEVTVSLDTQSINPAYRLGRLFAVLEDLQRSALPGLSATIRDKYLSSASSAPRATFPQLLRLAQAHIKKSQWGGRYDRDIGQVLEGVTDFPTTLDLEEQGLFFLGYYHQKAHRPAKADQAEVADDQTENAPTQED